MAYWTVFRKDYPQADTDMCFEMEMDYFTDKMEAVSFADDLQNNYADDGWRGHPQHNSKYYTQEIDERYIDIMERKACRAAASAMMADWF